MIFLIHKNGNGERKRKSKHKFNAKLDVAPLSPPTRTLTLFTIKKIVKKKTDEEKKIENGEKNKFHRQKSVGKCFGRRLFDFGGIDITIAIPVSHRDM